MGRQRGYTIIEVTLFLAISGLLVVFALGAFTNSVRNNRVTDALRSFEGFMFSQLSDVRSSVVEVQADAQGKIPDCNVPSTTHIPGASNQCIVMGKVVRFSSDNTLRVFNIVGRIEPDETGTCGVDAEGDEAFSALLSYCPRVLDVTKPIVSYVPEWQTRVSKVQFRNSANTTSQEFNNIAIIRDPASEIVYISPFLNSTLTGSLALRENLIKSEYTNTSGVICIDMGSITPQKGQIVFGGGEGVGSIRSTVDGTVAGLSC